MRLIDADELERRLEESKKSIICGIEKAGVMNLEQNIRIPIRMLVELCMSACLMHIVNAPTEETEGEPTRVRECMACKHFERKHNSGGICKLYHIEVSENHYCAKAERLRY